MLEEWKPVVGYEGLYSVSNLGRVRSEERTKLSPLQGTVRVKEKLRSLKTIEGYKAVGLSLNGKVKSFRVHRLVAEAFIINPENKPCVNHIDNDRANNSVDNLEWVTNRENTHHALKQDRLHNNIQLYAKPVNPEILEKAHVLVKQGVSYREIAEQVGCSFRTLYKYFPVKGVTES